MDIELTPNLPSGLEASKNDRRYAAFSPAAPTPAPAITVGPSFAPPPPLDSETVAFLSGLPNGPATSLEATKAFLAGSKPDDPTLRELHSHARLSQLETLAIESLRVLRAVMPLLDACEPCRSTRTAGAARFLLKSLGESGLPDRCPALRPLSPERHFFSKTRQALERAVEAQTPVETVGVGKMQGANYVEAVTRTWPAWYKEAVDALKL